jgi:predicted nucleic acid-binding protein
VTRYLLDTNIISNIVKPRPSATLLEWMMEQRDEDLFISAFTVAEIARGIWEMPEGKKRRELDWWFSGPEGPSQLFSGRVLVFGVDAGIAWALLMAEGKRQGKPRSAFDTMIAAIAATNDCVVVTDNEKDYTGLKFINPMRAKP